MKQILSKLSSNFHVGTPATNDQLGEIEKHFNCIFPDDYKEFLKFTNGLEGFTPSNYLVLWTTQELIQLNQAYNVKEFIANTIIFGSDGGEEAFAFDISSTDFTIIKLPFIGMGHIANEKLFDTFESFLESQVKENKSIFKRIFG